MGNIKYKYLFVVFSLNNLIKNNLYIIPVSTSTPLKPNSLTSHYLTTLE